MASCVSEKHILSFCICLLREASLHQLVTKNQMDIDQFLCLCMSYIPRFFPLVSKLEIANLKKSKQPKIKFAFEFWSQTDATKRALGCSFLDEVRKTFRKTYFFFMFSCNFSSYTRKVAKTE